MPTGLKRYYGAGYLHFITFSCYQRRALLGSARNRDWFLEILEQVRRRYRFLVAGYVVMPEHVHLLIGEPERGNPSGVLQALKQRFSRRLRRAWRKQDSPNQMGLWDPQSEEFHVWQRRFYDFVVWSEHKRVEKLRYMHRNPVKRGLVLEPEQWEWSSFRDYAQGQTGRVLVNAQPAAGGPPLRFLQRWGAERFDGHIVFRGCAVRLRSWPAVSNAIMAPSICTSLPAAAIIASPGWAAGSGVASSTRPLFTGLR